MSIKKWDVDFIGVLSDDEFVREETGKPFAAFVNNQNTVQFLIRVISQKPDGFPNAKLFTCYADDLFSYGFEDNLRLPDLERVEALRRFLANRIVIFKPFRKQLYDHTEVFLAKELRLQQKSDSYSENDILIPIPIFSQQQSLMSFHEFYTKLVTNKYVGRIPNISTEPNDTPAYIIWKDDENRFELLGEFDKHQHAHGGFSFSYKDEVKRAILPEAWHDDSYPVGSILFVTQEIYQQFSTHMDSYTIDGDEFPPDMQHVFEQTNTPIQATSTSVLAKIDGPVTSLSSTEHAEARIDSETQFMDTFIQTTREMNLLYHEKDLYNFHTALKSSTLNILSGMSGIGKSKLVQAYGRALGLANEQIHIIPVRPSWSDDADLIGYVDSLHMVYRPGDSGLINILMNAQKEENQRSKLYIICFDEMNLARVEHYFSQFLSVLEMEPHRRSIRLYNDELETRLYNSAAYPPTIQIGDNVLFIGTVNMDESTYHFSDKVLDRANVISLEVLSYNRLKDLKEEKKTSKKAVSFDTYESFRNKETALQLSDKELEFLWALHNQFQQANKNLGVGPRIVRQIDAYIKNLPENSHLSRRDAFDLQVVQRILTKLRGSEDQLVHLIGRLESVAGELHGGTLIDLLQTHKDISDFTKTRDVLIHKAKELKSNGYTV